MNSLSEMGNSYHKLLIIVGPSGVGKTTLISHLIQTYQDSFCFSVSHTTRFKREGEVDGVDYHFISQGEFNQLVEAQDFIECNIYSDNSYGTSKTQLKKLLSSGKICLLDVDIKGAKQIYKSGFESNFVSILPPSFEELKTRLIARNKDSLEVINKRLEISKVEMEEIEQAGIFNYSVINDNIEIAKQNLEKFILENYPHLIA